MSRHRNVRAMNYDDYDDYDDVYGRSVDDDYCISPTDASQFLYNRNQQQGNLGTFLVKEEPEPEEHPEDSGKSQQSFVMPDIDDESRVKLLSCLDEIRNIVGESANDQCIVDAVMRCNYDMAAALDSILKAKSNPLLSTVPTPVKPPPCDKGIGNKLLLDKTPTAKPNRPNDTIKVIPVSESNVKRGFVVANVDKSPCVSGRATPEIVEDPATPAANKSFRAKEPERNGQEMYEKERGGQKPKINVVVIGHVDAGKSTLMGHLLCDLNHVSQRTMHKYEQESKKLGKQSFMYAWVLDETEEERNRGITMDVGAYHFETDNKMVTILDAPGHRDFIPNMITGATQADVALLVVDATNGEFESGFELGGQTREHALLVRSLGVSQLCVVVNKLDTTNWSKDRFDEIVGKLKMFLKSAGYKEADVTYVPCSGLTGENLVNPVSVPELQAWYSGPTLVKIIDSFKSPERSVDKPFRMSVADIFKSGGSSTSSVSGKIESGVLAVGDKVLVCPLKEQATVKGLAIDDAPTKVAFAGDQVSVTLAGIDITTINVGSVLSDAYRVVPVTNRFRCRIVVFNVKIPLTIGFPVIIHHLALAEPAVVSKLKAELNKTTGEVIKKNPRCLGNNTCAIVEITTSNRICVEKYADIKELGRVMLRVEGSTIGAGFITDIF